MDVADLSFRVNTTDLERANRSLRDLRESGDRLETTNGRVDQSMRSAGAGAGVAATGFGALAGIVGAIGFGTLVSDAINTYRTFETMNATLKTLTGSASAAAGAFDVIKEFARTTPFDLEQAVQGFIKLKSLGLDPSEAALTSYGNTASAMGRDLNQMVEAVADAVTGEFERLKEFGIKAASEGEKVSFTFQGITTTVGKNAEEIEGYLRSIGDIQFAGAMEDQLNTLDAAISNMGISFKLFNVELLTQTGAAEAYKGAIRGITEIMDDLTKSIDPAVTASAEFFDQLRNANGINFGVISLVADGFDRVSDSIAPALPYLKDFGIALGQLAAAAVGVKVVTTALALLGGTVALLNPLSVALLALGAAAVVIQNNWQGFSSWWQTTWRDAEGAADRFVKWWNSTTFEEKELDIKTEILETAQTAADTFIKIWNDYELKEYVPEIALDVLDLAASKFGEFFDVVSKGLADSESEIRSSAIGSAFEEIWGDIVVAAERVWDDISAGIREAFPDIVSGIAEAFSDVDRIFGEVIKTGEAFVKDFGNIWEGLYPALKQIIESGWDIIVRVFDVAWIAIKASVETGWDLVTGVVEAGLQVLRGDFEAGWMTLADTAYEFGTNLVTAILSVFPAMQDAGREILVALGNGILASAYLVAEAFNSVLASAFDLGGQLAGTLFEAGQDVVSGFIEGITSGFAMLIESGGSLGKVFLESLKAVLGIASPSREAAELGRWTVEGFAKGIMDNVQSVVAAADGVSEAFLSIRDRLTASIEAQAIELEKGSRAAEIYRLSTQGMTEADAEAVIKLREKDQALKDTLDGLRLGRDALEDIRISQENFNIEITKGPVAARAHELAMRGMNAAMAESVAEAEAALTAQIEFRDGLEGAIANADSIKGALSNIGDFLKSWLQDKIAYFAANQITAMLGVDGAGIPAALSNIVQGAVTSVGNVITGFGGTMSSAFSSIFGGATASASAATAASVGSMQAAAASTSAMMGLNTGLLGTIPAIGAVAAGAALLSKVFGGDDGRNNLRDAMIQVVDGVVEVRQRMGDEGAQLVTQIQGVFDGLVNGVRTQAELLGVEGADAIMAGYTNAVGRLSIDDIAADSEAWLGRLGRVAYQQLYDTLGPELQAAIDASVDLANGSIDDIEAAFGRLTFIATDIVPLFDQAGIQIGNSTQQTIAGVEGIISSLEAMGIPINDAIGLIQQLIPGFDAATFAMQQSELALANWNESIGQISTSATTTSDDMRLLLAALDEAGISSGIAADMIQQFITEANGVATLDVLAMQEFMQSLDMSTEAGREAAQVIQSLATVFGVDLNQSMITSMDALAAYIASLDLTTQAGQDAAAAALAQIPAIQALEAAEAARIETMNGVAEAFRGVGVVFDTMIPSALGASEALVAAAGGMDQFTSDMSFYLNNFYSEAERGEIALANAAGEISAFNDMLGLTGAEAIDTREELRAYLDNLVASGAIYTEAGAEAYAAGLAVAQAIDAMTNSGLSLEEAIASLPPELQALAQGMGLIGDESGGAGEQMAQAAQMFYDAAQMIALAAGVAKGDIDNFADSMSGLAPIVGAAKTDVLAHINQFADSFPGISLALDGVAKSAKLSQEAMSVTSRTMDAETASSAAQVLQSVAAMTQALDQVAATMIASAGTVSNAAAAVTQSFMGLAQNIQAATAMVVAATNTAGMSMAEMARSMTASAGQVTQAGFIGSSAVTSLAQTISASAGNVNGSSLALSGSMQAMSGSITTAAGQVNSASATASGAMNVLAGIFSSGAKSISGASGIAGNAMQSLASKVQSGAGSINSAASNVGGGLNSVSSRIRGFLSSISSAAGTAAKSAQAAQQAAKNASSGGLGGIAGSFATGLDYVPRDGFVAELHKGEMVVPADIAEGLRAAGVYAQQPSANAPSVAVSRPNNSSDGVVVELRALRKEVESLRAQNAESSNRSNSILGNIAGTNSRQVQGIETVRRELDQQSKKLALR